MNETLNKIKTRGHWKVLIRPQQYVKERLTTLSECKQTIRDCRVLFRGWDSPHWDSHTELRSGLDYVEQDTDWENHIDFWRYYQSGQFVHYNALWVDWYDAITRYSPQPKYEPGTIISFIDVLYTLTETYEFASRLGTKELLGDSCILSIELVGAKDRTVVSLESMRFLREDYTCQIANLPREQTFSTHDLIARSAELALDHTIWILNRFNWDHVSTEMLREDQLKLIEKKL